MGGSPKPHGDTSRFFPIQGSVPHALLATFALGAILALGSTAAAQTFTVTPYGPSCGPIATGTVTPNGNTYRFAFTVSNALPNTAVMNIVGVNETAIPINFGVPCLLLTEIAFMQVHQTDSTGSYTWSHALALTFCGFARIQFAEISFAANNTLVVKASNGLFMNCN